MYERDSPQNMKDYKLFRSTDSMHLQMDCTGEIEVGAIGAEPPNFDRFFVLTIDPEKYDYVKEKIENALQELTPPRAGEGAEYFKEVIEYIKRLFDEKADLHLRMERDSDFAYRIFLKVPLFCDE